jgi:hypothetical protein
MEAVIKYLDNQNIPYVWLGENIKAFVRDRFEAHTLSSHFQLHNVYYEENEAPIELYGPVRVTKAGKETYSQDYDLPPAKPMRIVTKPRKKKEPQDEREFMGLFDNTDKPLTLFSQKKESIQ